MNFLPYHGRTTPYRGWAPHLWYLTHRLVTNIRILVFMSIFLSFVVYCDPLHLCRMDRAISTATCL